MAWSLVDHGQLGPDGQAERRVQAARAARTADPRRGLDHRRPAAARHDRPAGSSIDASPARSSPRPRRPTSPRPRSRKRELKERYGYRDPTRSGDDRRSWRTHIGQVRQAPPPSGRSPSSPSTSRHAEDLGRSLAELTGDPDAFAAALRTRPRPTWRIPSTSRASAASRPESGPCVGVRWPLIEAVKRGFREATRRERTSTWLFVADRLLREPELESRWFAFGLLERLDHRRAGADVAARPAGSARGRATGSRSIPSPTSSARASSPSRIAGPSSSSSSTRRPAGSGGSSAAPIATTPVRRSPPRPRAGRSRSTASALDRAADRRRRAGRPEGALLGTSQPRPGRSRGRRRVLRDGGRAGGRDERRPSRLGHPRRAAQARRRSSAAAIRDRLDGIRRRPGAPADLERRRSGRAVRPGHARRAA